MDKLMEQMNILIEKKSETDDSISTFDPFNIITYGFYAHTHTEQQIIEFIEQLGDFESVDQLLKHMKVTYDSVYKEIQKKFLKSSLKEMIYEKIIEFAYLPPGLDYELLWLLFNDLNDCILVPFDFEYSIYQTSGEFILSFNYDKKSGYFEITERVSIAV